MCFGLCRVIAAKASKAAIPIDPTAMPPTLAFCFAAIKLADVIVFTGSANAGVPEIINATMLTANTNAAETNNMPFLRLWVVVAKVWSTSVRSVSWSWLLRKSMI